MEIRLAENGDLSGWVRLVEPMRHLFPGLETPESMEGYARDVAGAISRQEALCAVENGTVCGVLAFSRAENELAFLAVSAQHRRQGIARKLAERMFRELDPSRPVKLITYRAGVPEGKPPGACTRGWDSVPAGWWRWTAARHRNSCARRKFPVLKGVRQSEIPAFRRPAHRQTP